MAAYAILRVGKLKTFGNLGGSEKHTARLQDTPNADFTQKNIRLIGQPEDPTLEQLVKFKIQQETKHKPRKDAVLCSEIFLSASPEYFRPNDPSKAGSWDKGRMFDFAQASTRWLKDTYGDKCIRAELHLDESTPHIHAYVVPINPKTQQLSHKELFGGNGRMASIKLSRLQDSYANALAPLGIERGVKGSKASHTKVKEYYEAVNREPLTLVLDGFAPQPGESAQDLFFRIKSDPTIQAINHQLADRSWALKEKTRTQQKVKKSEKLRQQLEERVTVLSERITEMDALVSQLRDLPLEDVVWNLGLDLDFKGKNRWKGQGHVIGIDGSKFYDFSTDSGGGGAVDLVMQVRDCKFKGAISWLNDTFGSSDMLRAVTSYARSQALVIAEKEPSQKFSPPIADSCQWQAVFNYLTLQRKLPKKLVEDQYEKGLVYADSFQNAVFAMRDAFGDVTGAFLRGTRGGESNVFLGYAAGTKRRASWFYITQGGSENESVERVVIAKSPIDVMSVAALEKSSVKTRYLAASGVCCLPLEYLKDKAVVVAFDGDALGNELGLRIKELLPQSTIVRPHGKDWNEDLQRLEVEGQGLQKQQRSISKKRGLEL